MEFTELDLLTQTLEYYKILGNVSLQHRLTVLLGPVIEKRPLGFYAVRVQLLTRTSIYFPQLIHDAVLSDETYAKLLTRFGVLHEIFPSNGLLMSRCPPVESFWVVIGAALVETGWKNWFEKYMAHLVRQSIQVYDRRPVLYALSLLLSMLKRTYSVNPIGYEVNMPLSKLLGISCG